MSLAGYQETNFLKRFSLSVFLRLFFIFTFCGLPSPNLYSLLKLFNIAMPFTFFLRNITSSLGLPLVIVVRVDLRLRLTLLTIKVLKLVTQHIQYKGSFGLLLGCMPRGSQELLRLAFGQPLAPPYKLLRPIALPSSLICLCTRLLPTLITISSSSIDSPITYARLTYSLPYTLAIMPHTQLDWEHPCYWQRAVT